ncbi:ISAzo13-like element transposase-related protein [Dapis sp. BLCC M229]
MTVNRSLCKNFYKKEIKVSCEEFNSIRIELDSFHGEWNYAIKAQMAV